MPVSCACACRVCVSGIRAQLHHGLNLQGRKQQPCASAWAETPGPQAPGWAPVVGWEGAGLRQLEEVAMLLTSFDIDKRKVRIPKEK